MEPARKRRARLKWESFGCDKVQSLHCFQAILYVISKTEKKQLNFFRCLINFSIQNFKKFTNNFFQPHLENFSHTFNIITDDLHKKHKV